MLEVKGKVSQEVQEIAADVATVAAGIGAFHGWISAANDVFTLAATIIACAAGIYAYRFHKARHQEIVDRRKRANRDSE